MAKTSELQPAPQPVEPAVISDQAAGGTGQDLPAPVCCRRLNKKAGIKPEMFRRGALVVLACSGVDMLRRVLL